MAVPIAGHRELTQALERLKHSYAETFWTGDRDAKVLKKGRELCLPASKPLSGRPHSPDSDQALDDPCASQGWPGDCKVTSQQRAGQSLCTGTQVMCDTWLKQHQWCQILNRHCQTQEADKAKSDEPHQKVDLIGEAEKSLCPPIPVSGNNCLFFHLHSSSCYTMSRCPLQFHFRMEVSMDYHPAKEQSGMEEEKKNPRDK